MATTTSCEKCGCVLVDADDSLTTCAKCRSEAANAAIVAAPTAPDNPYQAPAPVEAAEADEKPKPPKVSIFTAERPDRFFAKLLDLILLWIMMGGAYAIFMNDPPMADLGMLIAAVLWFVVQSIVIGITGQSIGKNRMRLRVVDNRDGSPPGFLRAAVVRWWLPGFVMFVAYPTALLLLLMTLDPLGARFRALLLLSVNPVNILWLIDTLWIFRRERRCLHDLLAGTKVMTVIPGRRRASTA